MSDTKGPFGPSLSDFLAPSCMQFLSPGFLLASFAQFGVGILAEASQQLLQDGANGATAAPLTAPKKSTAAPSTAPESIAALPATPTGPVKTRPAKPAELQVGRDHAYLVDNMESWAQKDWAQELFWVAVYEEDLVAKAATKAKLFAIVKDKGLPGNLVAFANIRPQTATRSR